MKAKVEQYLKKGIDAVLRGKSKGFGSKVYAPPEFVKKYLEKKNFVASKFETNGWEYDWWMDFTKDDKRFSAFGCGYYGNFEFSPTEAEEMV